MLATIICAVLAVLCLTQGAVEGAIALGILAVILYFFFGKKSTANGSTDTQPKPTQKEEQRPDTQYSATPSMIAHYRNSPVVAQIVREIRQAGAEVRISIAEGGRELTANGGGFYRYVFSEHGYQPLTLQEQEAFLRAIVEQLPHAETYSIGYQHREKSTVPLHYFVKTSYYSENQYRWNPESRAWEKMTKL